MSVAANAGEVVIGRVVGRRARVEQAPISSRRPSRRILRNDAAGSVSANVGADEEDASAKACPCLKISETLVDRRIP